MLGSIADEVRQILVEVEVRPPAAGVRPGMAPSNTRVGGGSIARQMQRPPTPRAQIDAQKKARQLQAAAQKTAMRQQRAAAQTRKTLPQSTAPAGPSSGQ